LNAYNVSYNKERSGLYRIKINFEFENLSRKQLQKIIREFDEKMATESILVEVENGSVQLLILSKTPIDLDRLEPNQTLILDGILCRVDDVKLLANYQVVQPDGTINRELLDQMFENNAYYLMRQFYKRSLAAKHLNGAIKGLEMLSKMLKKNHEEFENHLRFAYIEDRKWYQVLGGLFLPKIGMSERLSRLDRMRFELMQQQIDALRIIIFQAVQELDRH
jgi:hypothetical protein